MWLPALVGTWAYSGEAKAQVQKVQHSWDARQLGEDTVNSGVPKESKPLPCFVSHKP